MDGVNMQHRKMFCYKLQFRIACVYLAKTVRGCAQVSQPPVRPRKLHGPLVKVPNPFPQR